MKKHPLPEAENIKPDLKHDTMEYAASTEGDDSLDMDTEREDEIEEEDITADELELLENDSLDNQAEALNSAETDRTADDDVILNLQDDEEEYDDDDKALK